MTKAELIRKITKRAGIPDSEAKVFFEIFLKKASELLTPGQAVLLKGFGHFQYRKGKIKTHSTEDGGHNAIYVDLMVYYPSKQFEQEITENLIFNVPAIQQINNFNPVDAYFSLSIGKPVIPLKGVKSVDFFIPLTGMELRSLVETKVEKLVNDIEIVKEHTRGNEILVIDADSFDVNQLEFNWGEIPAQEISQVELTTGKKGTPVEETKENEIRWDFGENLKKEIEEESILDIEKEQAQVTDSDSDEEIEDAITDWNFGVTVVEEKDEQEISKPAFDNPVTEAQTNELINKFKPDTEEKENTDLEDIDGDFERVKSFSSKFFTGETKPKLDDDKSWKFGKTTVSYDDFEPDTQAAEESSGLPESGKKIGNKKSPANKILEKDTEKIVLRDDEINTLGATLEETVEIVEPPEVSARKKDEEKTFTDEPSYKRSKTLSRRLERDAHYSRKGSSSIFIISLFVIIALAVALYFYLNKSLTVSKLEIVEQGVQSSLPPPNIIDRDYTIPVSYPYEGNGTISNDKSISSITAIKSENPVVANKGAKKNTSVKSGSDKNNTREKTETVTSTIPFPKVENRVQSPADVKLKETPKKNDASEFSFENLPPPADVKEVHNNITQVGSTFTVQVSSWQSKVIAQEQVIKYISKGYDSYMEQADIPGKGTWYRVKIKGFKSMADAENFLIANQN